MNLTTYLHPIPRLRMNGATLLLLMYAYMACGGPIILSFLYYTCLGYLKRGN